MDGTTALGAWGNEQGVLIPRQARERAGLKLGDRLDVVPDDGCLILRLAAPQAPAAARPSLDGPKGSGDEG